MSAVLESEPRRSIQVGFARKIRAYIALTKPRVIELLLVVTVPSMILGARGIPDLWLVGATLVGGAMSAGAAGAFNCYIDRDADRLMKRTLNRPLVTGEVTDREALVFAGTLGLASLVFMWFTTNPLASGLTLIAIVLYVVLYSMVLKRRTEQNIIWGGAAGCMPVLIGWAAATGRLDAGAFVLFLIIFLWTPAHYWPLSMKYREDYRAAGIPMLAVLRRDAEVGLQVVLYTCATVAATLILVPLAAMGTAYLTVALAAGAWFIAQSVRLYLAAVTLSATHPMRVFHGSIGYLTVVFLAIGIDPLLKF